MQLNKFLLFLISSTFKGLFSLLSNFQYYAESENENWGKKAYYSTQEHGNVILVIQTINLYHRKKKYKRQKKKCADKVFKNSF